MIINHNIAAMNSQSALFNTNLSMEKTLERLSSGYRINSAADDAAGLAISEKMRSQVKGLAQSSGNAQDGKRLLKLADSALGRIHDMLGRLEELATQGASDINTSSDRGHLQDEVSQILSQINQVANTTQYNTRKILSGELQVDANTIDTTLRIDSKPVGSTVSSVNLNLGATANRANVAMVKTGATLAATATAAQAGTLYVNGSAITVAVGESAATLAAKVNLVSATTKVVAGSTAANGIVNFASGYQSGANMNTYEGSNYRVDVSSDNANMMAWLNLQKYDYTAGATGTWNAGSFGTGKDLTGTILIGGTAATIVGSKAIAGNASGAAGLAIQTDVNATINLGIAQAAAGGPTLITQTGVTDIAISINTNRQLKIQVGANADENLQIGIQNVSASGIGMAAQGATAANLSAINVQTQTGANDALKVIQKAVEDLSSQRSAVGAMMNRLDYVVSNLNSQYENMQAAESRIRDADMAFEMTEFTKQQILLQAGTAMLAQANAKPQAVLQLLK